MTCSNGRRGVLTVCALLLSAVPASVTPATAAEQDCGTAVVCAQVAPELAPSVFDDVIGEFNLRST